MIQKSIVKNNCGNFPILDDFFDADPFEKDALKHRSLERSFKYFKIVRFHRTVTKTTNGS